MVEQSCSGKAHCHSVLVAGFDNLIVSHASAGLCHVGNTASLTALDIIAKGEECVASQRNAGNGIQICSLFFLGEYCGAFGKELLPLAVCKNFIGIFGKININTVVSVRSADICSEGEV